VGSDISVVYRFSESFFMKGGAELALTLGGRSPQEGDSGEAASAMALAATLGFGMLIEP